MPGVLDISDRRPVHGIRGSLSSLTTPMPITLLAISILIPFVLTLISCSPHPSATASTRAPASLMSEVTDSAGVRILTLSHSPTDLSLDGLEVTELTPDLRVGYGRPGWSGTAADLVSLGAGQFAVLDRSAGRIVVFDSLGEETTLSAPGATPAGSPLRAPLALTLAGEHLIVWQALSSPAFSVIGPTGALLTTAAAELAGDWALSRDPDLGTHGPRLRLGPEDLTRRLAPLGESGFIHLLQPNEREEEPNGGEGGASPPAHLIHYGLDGLLRDTITTLAGPPTIRYDARRWSRREGREVIVTRWKQPLYSGRPVWTTGDGWIALGHGDSAQLVVQRMSTRPVRGDHLPGGHLPGGHLLGDTTLIIRWPANSVEVSENDRRDAALGVIVQRLLNYGNVKEFMESESRPTLRVVIERELEHHLDFAEFAPMVTAAYGAGACLFLGGYLPAEWPDGTSLTWLAFDLRSGEDLGAFRLAPTPLNLRGSNLELKLQSAAVRAIDGEFAYTASRGRDGSTVIERYRLPELGCTAE